VSYLAYGSIIDNTTGDPTTVLPFRFLEADGNDAEVPVWVAAAASTGGIGTTRWETDLGVFNLDSSPVSYRIQLLPRDRDNSTVYS